jgi:hypothetical protein
MLRFLRFIIVAVLCALAMMAGLVLGGQISHSTVAGVASDHSHTVSEDEFVRILRGNGTTPVSVHQAYMDTVEACNVIMRARWQDRPSLISAYPANIQDPTLRNEVYTAIFSGKVCVA